MCLMRDWEVVTVESDTVSGYTGETRPGWERVQQMIAAGEVDVVVVWKIDRLTRTVSGLVDLVRMAKDTGVNIATTDGFLDLSTPIGRAIITILATMAQLETELKQERQRAANQQRRERGEPWKSGWKTFGYELATGDVIEPEAALIRKGAEDFLGGKPMNQIAKDWDASGIKPRSGGNWNITSVRTVLVNPRLAGHQTYKGEIIGEGAWEPILDKETHALVSARVADPSRRTGGSKAGPRAEYLLSALATCATCGEKVQSRGSYRCKNSHVSTDQAKADATVVAAFSLAATMMLPGLLVNLPTTGKSKHVLTAIDEERTKQRELADSFAAGRIPLAVLESGSALIEKRIAKLEQEMGGGEQGIDPRRLNAQAVRNFANGDLNTQRAILSRVARIKLFPKGRGRKNVGIREQVAMQVKVRGRWVDLMDRKYDD